MATVPDRVPEGRIKLTYDDYAELPSNGLRHEILDGELEMTPAPSPRHQAVSRNLEFILHAHALATACGSVYDAPIDVILSPTTIVQPDLVFIAAGRDALVSARGIEGPPDLVVEIVSPSTIRQDRVTKPALYARFGVQFFWLLDPGVRSLEEHALAAGGYRQVQIARGESPVTTMIFPELVIDLGRVWL